MPRHEHIYQDLANIQFSNGNFLAFLYFTLYFSCIKKTQTCKKNIVILPAVKIDANALIIMLIGAPKPVATTAL